MTFYKIGFLALSIFFTPANSVAQENKTIRNIICLTPAKAKRINGLAIGAWNPPKLFSQQCNGLNFEILGKGWLTPFLGLDDGGFVRQTRDKQVINGLSLGLTLFNGKVNGVAVSPIINTTYEVNGLKIGFVNVDLCDTRGLEIGLINKADTVKGLQIGLINKAETVRGAQVGLININKSRTTLFLNWRTPEG
ncbi:MAG: LA_2272 family surface repeat-containing protein [Bacteroidia bacterium]